MVVVMLSLRTPPQPRMGAKESNWLKVVVSENPALPGTIKFLISEGQDPH